MQIDEKRISVRRRNEKGKSRANRATTGRIIAAEGLGKGESRAVGLKLNDRQIRIGKSCAMRAGVCEYLNTMKLKMKLEREFAKRMERGRHVHYKYALQMPRHLESTGKKQQQQH